MWTDVDPDRTGVLPFVWDKDFGFERYVEYALDVPMYFLYRGGKYEDATQQRCTFREYMEGKMPDRPGIYPSACHVMSVQWPCLHDTASCRPWLTSMDELAAGIVSQLSQLCDLSQQLS